MKLYVTKHVLTRGIVEIDDPGAIRAEGFVIFSHAARSNLHQKVAASYKDGRDIHMDYESALARAVTVLRREYARHTAALDRVSARLADLGSPVLEGED